LSAAPPGLDLFGGFYPQLKLRAIFGCPLRDEVKLPLATIPLTAG